MRNTKRFLLLVLANAVAAGVWALTPKTLETFGVQQHYAARTSAVSSHTVTGILVSWSMRAVGGTADFTIKHSTGANSDYQINASSTIYLLSGQELNDRPGGMVVNPIFSIDRVTTPGATIYVDITYLTPREVGTW